MINVKNNVTTRLISHVGDHMIWENSQNRLSPMIFTMEIRQKISGASNLCMEMQRSMETKEIFRTVQKP